MTKIELTQAIMNSNAGVDYKKTNLMKMHIADLKELYQDLVAPEETVPPLLAGEVYIEQEMFVPVLVMENAPEEVLEPIPTPVPVAVVEAKETPVVADIHTQATEALTQALKSIKGLRMKKSDFKAEAQARIEGVLMAGDVDDVEQVVESVLSQMMENLTHLAPINEAERKMLETIPKTSEFQDCSSVLTSKALLSKVQELHGIPASTSRALMVSLRKKGFYDIKGKKSGEKVAKIHLLERGINFLNQNNLVTV